MLTNECKQSHWLLQEQGHVTSIDIFVRLLVNVYPKVYVFLFFFLEEFLVVDKYEFSE
jgi:hypothetical protein